MTSTINTNTASLSAQRHLALNTANMQTSMERLASGLRVNSAKDDAAGLAIANNMTLQIRGQTVAQRNANDGISIAQTADGALGSITDTLQRMRDLAVQANNFGAMASGDRAHLQTEFAQLGQEVKRIIGSTQMNGKNVLLGGLSHANFQVGANTGNSDEISFNISSLSAMSGIGAIAYSISPLRIGAQSTGGDITSTNVGSVINQIDMAVSSIDSGRSILGAAQNRFMMSVQNLQSSVENQTAARGRIMDADFAAETANLSRGQIMVQAGTAMLAQANASPQYVVALLR